MMPFSSVPLSFITRVRATLKDQGHGAFVTNEDMPLVAEWFVMGADAENVATEIGYRRAIADLENVE